MSIENTPGKRFGRIFGALLFSLIGLSAAAISPTYASPSSKEILGGLLFFDTSLSEPAGQSCASCHSPSFAFTDPDYFYPTSQGVDPKNFGNRNTPSASYAAFSPPFHFDNAKGIYMGGQFWDGRAATLEEQAKGPFLNPVEMANTSKQQVVGKVQTSIYSPLFKKVFGKSVFSNTDLAYDKIAEAIAAFERTPVLNRFSSKYDAYLKGKAKLSAQELRGLALFEDPAKGNCAICHTSRPDATNRKPLFTDFSYDNLGVPRNPDNPFYNMPYNTAGKNFVDQGLGGALGAASENGKQKVPTLRNIAITAPYMHNGYFKTLRGVVDFYNTRDVKPPCSDPFTAEHQAITQGCWPAAEVVDTVNHSELGNLGLSSQEVDDIVAFMLTLTDR
jgi:cytochrome c peroxidase